MPPAAKVTRIQRRKESQEAGIPASTGPAPATAVADPSSRVQHEERDQAGMLCFDPLSNVMGAITERRTEAPSGTLPPMAASAGPAPAFPMAVHRSKSKVMRVWKSESRSVQL